MEKSPTKEKSGNSAPEGAGRIPLPVSCHSAPSPTSALHTYFAILVIAGVGVAAYSNTFHVPFALDDLYQISNNRMLRDLGNFWLALKGQHFASASDHYIPSRFVGYLSFALNYRAGGLEVWGYHLANLAIHVMNAVLVYFLVALTFKTPYFRVRNMGHGAEGEESGRTGAPAQFSRVVALFAALLFVAHPVQTQAVTYVVQRFASLATMFYLLSLVMYIKGRLEAGGRRREDSHLKPLTYYLLALFFAVCAMKTKEISFTLPLVVVLYDFLFFAMPLKRRLLFLLPVLLTIVIIPLGIVLSGKPLGEVLSDVGGMTRVQTQIPRWDYLMTQMRVLATYVRLIFLPLNQNLDYDFPIYHSLFTRPVFLSFLFLLTLFGAAVWLLYKSRRVCKPSRIGQSAKGVEQQQEPERDESQILDGRDQDSSGVMRVVAFGIFWFFITLAVESSVIPIADVIFEHRLYLPSVGLLTSISAGGLVAARVLKRERLATVLFVLVTVALAGATLARNNTWRDGARLWEDVVKKSPQKARPHDSLGVAYAQQRRLNEAAREFRTALSIDSGYAEAHNNLGVIYGQQGRMDEAMGEFRAALKNNPDYAEAHNNLGVVYRRSGAMDEAMGEFRAALKNNPDYADAHNNLGVVYWQRGLIDEAAGEFQTALRLNPRYAAARRNLEAASQLRRRRERRSP